MPVASKTTLQTSSVALLTHMFCSINARCVQTAIWLQITISAELLIFSARAPGLFFLSRPSIALAVSTLTFGGLLSTLLAVYAFPASRNSSRRGMRWDDVLIIWAYDIASLFILDVLKLAFKHTFDHATTGVLDEARYAREDADRVLNPPTLSAEEPDTPHSASLSTGPRALPSARTQRVYSASTPRTHTLRAAEFLVTGRSLSAVESNSDAPLHYSQAPGRDLARQGRRAMLRTKSLTPGAKY